jgi:hypothetical protein
VSYCLEENDGDDSDSAGSDLAVLRGASRDDRKPPNLLLKNFHHDDLGKLCFPKPNMQPRSVFFYPTELKRVVCESRIIDISGLTVVRRHGRPRPHSSIIQYR